jgi:hypothetical protein
MDGSRTAAAAPQGLSLHSPSSSVSSADSPILLDLTSPSVVATEAWRLVDRWQAEAMLAMDTVTASRAHAESWRQDLRQELALMLRRLDAHVDGPCDRDVMRSSPSLQPSQPSIASSISTEQETPGPVHREGDRGRWHRTGGARAASTAQSVVVGAVSLSVR